MTPYLYDLAYLLEFQMSQPGNGICCPQTGIRTFPVRCSHVICFAWTPWMQAMDNGLVTTNVTVKGETRQVTDMIASKG